MKRTLGASIAALWRKIFPKQTVELFRGDVLLRQKGDRRILPNVPDARNIRSNVDRRSDAADGENVSEYSAKLKDSGRYLTALNVNVRCRKGGKLTGSYTLTSIDASSSGILLKGTSTEQMEILKAADEIRLDFTIVPGSMPEGFESRVRVKAKLARAQIMPDGVIQLGFQFDVNLAEYINRRRGRYMLAMSVFMMVGVTGFVLMMRAESIIFFKFMKMMYLYSLVTAGFLLTRYLFGMLYRPVPINPDYTPSVTIIIPCFNEEEWIDRTIISCMNQDYPADKLQVIIVDDRSTDNSVEVIKATIDRINQGADYLGTRERLSYLVMPKNGGKREALAYGMKDATGELTIFVDSDSFLDPFAVRNLVQPFQDPKMGGVAGRTDVANVHTNWLTKMQTTRYYVSFRIMKAAEAYFDTVSCLSGPLACYRTSIVHEFLDAWLQQKFLGRKATFGDDRALTNMVLSKYRTYYQDSAICATIVPNKQKQFLKQQMRWKRSWLRESVVAVKFMHKKEPFAALFFYMGFIVPFLAPIIVTYNLIVVPITQKIFPSTFLIGLLMMTFLMSFAYLMFKRSNVWIYCILFCVYYELVLLWQMPYAWITFWKSTWGTRMTPEDLEAAERKKAAKARRAARGKKAPGKQKQPKSPAASA